MRSAAPAGLLALALSAAGCPPGGPADGGGADAGEVDAGLLCKGRDCRLDCDPQETWLALSADDAGIPAVVHLGDADPASPAEVGDGRHHLFVGVSHQDLRPGSSCGRAQEFLVLLHEAISDRPDRGYRLSPQPLVSSTIIYDQFGMETPSYFRADARREYLYYCAIYRSYDCRDVTGVKGKLMALRRIDGGTWERVPQDVAPFATNPDSGVKQTSQCEPDVAFDADAGLYNLFFIADDGPNNGGLYVRTSADPERFDAPDAGERLVMRLAVRPGVAFDPYDGVWRLSLDSYGGTEAFQAWSPTLGPGLEAALGATTGLLHSSKHALHPLIHREGQPGAVSQSVSPLFPDAGEVIFFYTGIGSDDVMRVYGQRCTRR